MALLNATSIAIADRVRPLGIRDRTLVLAQALDRCSQEEAGEIGDQLVEIVAGMGGTQANRVSLFARIAGVVAPRFRSRVTPKSDPMIDAMAAVVAHWAVLPARTIASALAAGKEVLGPAAQQVLRSPNASHRRGVVELCRQSGDATLYCALATLAGDSDAGIAATAQRTLRDIVVPACPRDGSPHAADSTARLEMEESIATALAISPDMRTRAIFLAAVALLDSRTLSRKTPGGLTRWFKSPDAIALARTLGTPRWSLARRRAWEWLKDDRFRGECAARLVSTEHAVSPAEHETVLTSAHLALNPRRRCAELGARDAKKRLIPSREDIEHLSPDALAGFARFARATNAAAEATRAAAEPLLTHGNESLRHSLAQALSPSALEDLCFDPSERVARSAFLRWSVAGERGAGDAMSRRLTFTEDPRRNRHLHNCARSPHESVRHFASFELDAIGERAALRSLSVLRDRRRLAREGEDFARRIAAVIGSAPEGSAILAVRQLRRLSMVASAHDEIVAAALDVTKPKLAATAIGAMTELDSPAVRDALKALLHAGDDRVRANAVEAAAQRSRTHSAESPSLREFEADAHHRVRANALRAAFAELKPGRQDESARAVAALAAMVGDSRASHRLAAAWLGGRLIRIGRLDLASNAAKDFTARVRVLATSDDDVRTRARAGACVRAADLSARGAWAAAASAVAGDEP